MKFSLVLVAFALVVFVQAEEPQSDGDNQEIQVQQRSLKDTIKAKGFVDNFVKEVKKAAGAIRKGGSEALKAADKLVQNLKGPCKDVNKVLKKGIIQMIPIPNIKVIATSIQAVCALVINNGVPRNADELKKFIDALKGF